jgi:hypothetical protein
MTMESIILVIVVLVYSSTVAPIISFLVLKRMVKKMLKESELSSLLKLLGAMFKEEVKG